jgi:drug/metabolite transporter (DMT)-like permease
MIPSNAFGILSGLASALVWGAGDFVGGVATRRASQFKVVALSAIAGLCFLIPAAVIAGESFPSGPTIAWSVAAGICGAVGIAALYQGLSTGAAAVVAPTSAVVGAALPVLAGSLLQSLPLPTDLAGIGIGLTGIWLVSSLTQDQRVATRSGVLLGILAGAGFGGFFVLIAQVEAGVLFTPLVFVKLAALVFGLVIIGFQRQEFPSLRANPLALLSGVLDTGGNLLFLLAARATSLAVAAVLSSMYPAATVGLSVLLLHERLNRRQIAGVVLCLAAVALISL